jgi:hypothetical protein
MPRLTAATAAAEARLHTIAATESATAFNDETSRLAEKHARVYPFLLLYWDATLDRRACPRCVSLEGQVKHWGFAFKVTPAVHPQCRCRLGVLFLPLVTITEDDE